MTTATVNSATTAMPKTAMRDLQRFHLPLPLDGNRLHPEPIGLPLRPPLLQRTVLLIKSSE
jgi:hypothetical protein